MSRDGSHAARLRAAVKAAATRLGFDASGICDLRPIERTALIDWLERGYAGTMRYMHRQAPKRQAPERIAPGSTRAVVVLKRPGRRVIDEIIDVLADQTAVV